MTLENSNLPASVSIFIQTSDLLNNLTGLWFADKLTTGEYDQLTMLRILETSKPVHELSPIEKLSYQIAQVF